MAPYHRVRIPYHRTKRHELGLLLAFRGTPASASRSARPSFSRDAFARLDTLDFNFDLRLYVGQLGGDRLLPAVKSQRWRITSIDVSS